MKRDKTGEFNRLILRRKVRSTLNMSSIGGRNKKVQIEVRKKRTYMQYVTQDVKDNIDHNNEIKFSVDKEVVIKPEITQNKLIINTGKNNLKNLSLLSKVSLQKNNNGSERIICQKIMEDCESNRIVEKKLSEVKNKKIHILSKQNKERFLKQHVELEDKIVSHTVSNVNSNVRSNSMLDKKDNERKLDNERKHRSRVRMRYKSGGTGKLIKQKRNNNYHIYDIAISAMSGESDNKEYEQLCVSNRIYKNKRKQNHNTTLVQRFNKPEHTIVYDIVIGETISVSELANKMSIKGSHIIKVMMKLGLIATINQIIDQETAQLIAEEMGHNVILRRENELEESIMHDRINIKYNNDSDALKNRAPIVTVMGHVDHGKTSLLDYIRSTKIASNEVGGITQSIGAYHVNTNNGMITFIDTPGHAAFTAMRARGAKLTDMVILVVAADDGVMLQTIEAIQHAKAANVPVLVAINKIDKLEANFERIQNELSKYEILSEEWGGDVQFIKVSAISGEGIDNLLDAILLQSEMLDLKVMHHGMANAVVIDSFIDKGRGPVVTVLVQEGVLKCGDVILCGTEYGRIRAMRDECGRNIVSAGPSIPVELLGLSGTPFAGDQAIVVRDEKKAREVAFYRQGKFREVKLARNKREKIPNLKNIFSDVNNVSTIPELHLVIKTSTQSYLEAIRDVLTNLSTQAITIKIVSSSIGGITETDAVLAATTNSMILGFNVKADSSARRVINAEGLDVRYYSVIYDLLKEVKKIVQGMLVPKYKCEIIGLAEVRNVFCSPKYGNIAGCMVIEGVIKRFKKVRVVRNSIVIYTGELESLRRFHNDVNEVKIGIECGIGIKNYNDILSGDVIEVFDVVEFSHVSSDREHIY